MDSPQTPGNYALRHLPFLRCDPPRFGVEANRTSLRTGGVEPYGSLSMSAWRRAFIPELVDSGRPNRTLGHCQERARMISATGRSVDSRYTRRLPRGLPPSLKNLGPVRPLERRRTGESKAPLAVPALEYKMRNRCANPLSPPRGFRLCVESGICWLSWVQIDLDPEFARELLNATDAVVVWEPRQEDVNPAMGLERVIAVIRGHFEPEARFGSDEICRRKPVDSGTVSGAGRRITILVGPERLATPVEAGRREGRGIGQARGRRQGRLSRK